MGSFVLFLVLFFLFPKNIVGNCRNCLIGFFPMIGKLFSNGWKNRVSFPMIGKNFRKFSNDWKKCFQWLENFGGAGGRMIEGAGGGAWQKGFRSPAV
jgi:hypothetical protein